MSKSLGTGIDPLDLIEGGPRPPVYPKGGEFPAYGADALRFGLLAMSSSQDVRFNEERVKQGRDLANKLWNASRLILLRVSDVEPDPASGDGGRGPLDRLAAGAAHRARATELYDGFRFSPAALELYGAFWSELCDWYLEVAKPRLYEEDNEQVSGVLLWALERTLRLLHPVMPFVTEEIWSFMPGRAGLLAVAPMARGRRVRVSTRRRKHEVERLIEAVTALRRYRDEVGREGERPGPRPARGRGLRRAARAARAPGALRAGRSAASPDGDVLATVPIPGGGVQVLPSEAFDADEARALIAARREQLAKEVERAERKLANEQFVAKAPAAVVEEERRKLEEYREALRRLDE